MSIASRCLSRLLSSALLSAVCALSACSHLDPFRTEAPPDSPAPSACAPRGKGQVDSACDKLSTEVAPRYALHFIEFDDQGWVYDKTERYGEASGQLDRAIKHVRRLLDEGNVVRLYVYVHGWRHFAASEDKNVQQFRLFLTRRSLTTLPGANEKVVGIYVGWRGIAIPDVLPFNYLTFWDRKATAERIAQGSVRELFGRLSALYKSAKPTAAQAALPGQAGQLSRLHTHVIGHSFGASVAFRSMSQSLINDFAGDLDGDLASITRFIDMVVLVNPAIEAARFEALRSVAMKRAQFCRERNPGDPAALCDQPSYQGPALAIFSSEGDRATEIAFPVGSSLSNFFEHEISDRERRANRSTIGWDDAYMTHRLTPAPAGPVRGGAAPGRADHRARRHAAVQAAGVEGLHRQRHVAAAPADVRDRAQLQRPVVERARGTSRSSRTTATSGTPGSRKFWSRCSTRPAVHPQLAKPDTAPRR